MPNLACKVSKAVEAALAKGIGAGIKGLVDMTVQAEVWLLGKLAGVVFDVTSMQQPDATFFSVYNQIAGVMLGAVLVYFFVSLIINVLRFGGGGVVSTLGGVLRAVLGITFAGGIAWVMVRGSSIMNVTSWRRVARNRSLTPASSRIISAANCASRPANASSARRSIESTTSPLAWMSGMRWR